jgi:DNA-binding CsgD family transcriptional regulator/tetratricopeptide (TPR) repeat protein
MGTGIDGVERRASLLGRARECGLLDGLVGDIRRGESRSLVLKGEAGIGKTALLDYLIESAPDITVLRAAGVESEMELAYAGVHQLCGPILNRRDALPGPQQEALEIVFGRSAGAAPDRFIVALGVLSLLSEAATERALLCVVDDAQWLDQASALTLAFVARRLLADRVGIVFAAREPGDELQHLSKLDVTGVSIADARALLSSAVPFKLDERVRDQIIAETRGNPLALLELPRTSTATQLAGGFGLVDDASLSGRIEESFARRLDSLSEDARRLLLVAAAEPTGDPLLLWRAAERLGMGEASHDEVDTDGLLRIADRVTFRHPLVRSAVYASAAPQERRAVHLALAQETDREVDPDRRAWHLATAASGPDEEVALELELSADRATSRGGLATAAAFLNRAVALTEDPTQWGNRALAAAGASLHAGAFTAAGEMLAALDAHPLDELQRARVELLRARVAFAINRGSGAPTLLLGAARRLEPLNPELARATYLEAVAAAQFASRLAQSGEDVLTVAEAALSAPDAPDARPSDLLLDGLATLLARGYVTAVPLLQSALSAFRAGTLTPQEPIRWTSLACRTAVDTWDFDAWEILSEQMVTQARELGAPAGLATALTLRMVAHLHAGQMGALTSLLDEVEALVQATGVPFSPYGPLVLLAWRGQEPEATALIQATVRGATRRGEGQALALAHYTHAVLLNGLGRYDEAAEAAREGSAYPPDFTFRNWSLAELVEAAVRSGDTAAATEALEHLTHTTEPCGTDWALGTQARCRALLSTGDDADVLYREAITRLERSRVLPTRARAHLVYGEWLRRENRRVDSRSELRVADDMFSAMGMEAFAERARKELLATGEKARRRTVETRDDLTAQERQIAQLARDGLSNPEIGARLFLSPRTVEWHLRKVYGKLSIRSRYELGDVLAGDKADQLTE